jgi:hypothetical protein
MNYAISQENHLLKMKHAEICLARIFYEVRCHAHKQRVWQSIWVCVLFLTDDTNSSAPGFIPVGLFWMMQ